MIGDLKAARARRAGVIVAASAILAAVAAVTVGVEARSLQPAPMAGAVLPAFNRHFADATRIRIVTKDKRYEIVRTQAGWALKDRGGFPVKRERLGQFTDGLKSLAFVRSMTSDPAKFERLGVGDPEKGGSGVLVEVEGQQGALIADLVIGSSRLGSSLFARVPGKSQAWQIRGELPPLREPSRWLDLVPFTLVPDRIAAVDVAPPSGPPYRIERASGEAAFRLVAPGGGAGDPSVLASVATGLGDLDPADVQAQSAVAATPAARVRLSTFDGLAIDAEVFDTEGKHWLKAIAHAADPARADEADKINAATGRWAYELGYGAFHRLAPSLAELTGAAATSAP